MEEDSSTILCIFDALVVYNGMHTSNAYGSTKISCVLRIAGS